MYYEIVSFAVLRNKMAGVFFFFAVAQQPKWGIGSLLLSFRDHIHLETAGGTPVNKYKTVEEAAK